MTVKPSVVEKTKETIVNLFRHGSLWKTIMANDTDAATVAPSSPESAKAMHISVGCDLSKPWFRQVEKTLLSVYSQPISATFWSTLCSHVMNGISGPLFSYGSLGTSGETNVRAYLIEPVMRELTQHLSYLPSEPPKECSLFTASITMEQAIRLHPGCGRPATADFCVVLRDEYGQVIGFVPGEAKQLLLDKHMSQLSVYMWKVGTGRAYLNRSVIGLAMDHQFFRVALSPLVFQGGRLVPITYVTPPIAWRLPAVSPTAVSESGLLLLSTVLLINIPSFSVGFDDPALKRVSDLLYEQPFVFDASRDEMQMSYTHVIKEMEKVKEELTELKEEHKQLREADIVQKKEIAELKASNERIQQHLVTHLIRICSGMSSPGTTPEKTQTPSRKRPRRSSEGAQPQPIEL